ncbi:MAG TPA: hypothetical protein VF380_03235 [Solirubrobacteraceae bacterium]
MRRGRATRWSGAAIALLCALAVAGSAGARSNGTWAHAASAPHLQVKMVEYRLALSRTVVSQGRLSLDALDAGIDPHNLRLRRLGAAQEIGAPELRAGERWDGSLYLRPGVYRLWCSLPQHARLGMRATLRVTG